MTQQPRSQRSTPAPVGGWLVEVVVPIVGLGVGWRRVFAVRTDDDTRAIQVVRDALNGLHCSVKARLRLTPRALAQLDLGYEGIKEIGD